MKTTVDELMAKAFYPGRPRRSEAYRLGVQAKLRRDLERLAIDCQYREGTAEFDAFFAGIDEGRAIFRAQS